MGNLDRKENDFISDLQGKRVLFIAYFFPPVLNTGLPAAMRIIKFLRNFSGGELHVLTTQEKTNQSSSLSHITLPVNGEYIHRVQNRDYFGSALKFQLALKNKIKGITRQKRYIVDGQPLVSKYFYHNKNSKSETKLINKIKDFTYNLFYFPDQAAPWIIPASIAGRKLTKKHRIDVIFATGSPWSGLIAGYLVSKWTKTPLIIDFRDPWTTNPFHQSKGKWLDSLAKRIEHKIVNHAGFVTLNTDALREEFSERFSDQAYDKLVVIPNGFDPVEFEFLNQNQNQNQNRVYEDLEILSNSSNTLLLVHAGFLYGPRDPKVLLFSIRETNRKLKEYGKKIYFIQIGKVQLHYTLEVEFGDLIENGALSIMPPMPYQDCLKVQSLADVLVNLQPGTKTQVPSKIYDYIALQKYILNITERDSALSNLVLRYKLGSLFYFDDHLQLEDWLFKSGLSVDHFSEFTGYDSETEFKATSLAKKLGDIIKKMV